MLSRSNSNAADRIRRAKSTSSTHTTSSGHHRQTTTIDPFVNRQQAEAAAIEAYERARQHDEPAQRPVPPKLQRRRSQANGKSEGSHFENARRRSVVRTEDSTNTRPALPQRTSTSPAKQSESGEERVVTRRRSVIPPSSEVRQSQTLHSSSLSTAGRFDRSRRQSEYTDGSPAPRYSQHLHDKRSTHHTSTIPVEHNDGYGGNLAHLSDFGQPNETAAPGSAKPWKDQSYSDTLAKARDKCLQDFQTKGVRERRSFILGPFQKRRATTAGNNFDTSLPPFNYAEEDNLMALPPAPAPDMAESKLQSKKSRTISDTLKGRLRKVFRTSSKATTGMPPQQVEAKDHHFAIRDYDISEAEDVSCLDMADPFMTVANENPKPAAHHKFETTTTNTSSCADKSRVTSWTTSTVAGTSSMRTNDGATAGTRPTLKNKDSAHVLRKASSFFGRPIQNKLRRASKAELRGSEESEGLYNALQKRIRPSVSIEPVSLSQPQPHVETVGSRTGSALATLPSQKAYSMSLASDRSRAASTIRAVTPVDPAGQVDIPSPVQEVMSPDADECGDETVICYEVQSTESPPKSDLKRRSGFRAPPPTKDQMARRMERYLNRWKAPLDDLSPAPRPMKAHMEDNPYELRSLSQSMRQTTPTNDLPHHAKVANDQPFPRTAALSPSIYSRATDGASPRAATPDDVGMTTITITGREVRRYSISPAKRANVESKMERNSNSRDWRRWLSGEMSNFGGDTKSTPEPQHIGEAVTRTFHSAVVNDHAEQISRPGSISPTIQNILGESLITRSRRGSSTSGYMNERYPIVDRSRNSSRQSFTVSRKTSFEPGRTSLGAQDRKFSADKSMQMVTLDHSKTAAKRPSTAHKDQMGRSQSAFESRHVEQSTRISTPVEQLNDAAAPTRESKNQEQDKTVNRPRSAYELRANYKNSLTNRSRPLEIRRKALAENSILGDSTIVNISAGPYAPTSQRLANRENAPPPSLESPLPALSSSEWLAAGASKKREARKAVSMNPIGGRTRKDVSPQRSPGQRMVTSWLDERKSKENTPTPAFV